MLKKHKSHRELAKKLRSSKYLTSLAEWESYLAANLPSTQAKGSAQLPVKELANRKIWKIYKQAVKEGEAIDNDSPPEAMHKLRKTCKKLRYLMEFFQQLYPERQLEKLIKPLKRLQDVLGEYQDLSIQQERLKQFSEEMQGINTPSRTFLAMGVLIQELETRKVKARDHFGVYFDAFRKENYHASFHVLFSPGKT